MGVVVRVGYRDAAWRHTGDTDGWCVILGWFQEGLPPVTRIFPTD